jgi:hypothetical protein
LTAIERAQADLLEHPRRDSGRHVLFDVITGLSRQPRTTGPIAEQAKDRIGHGCRRIGLEEMSPRLDRQAFDAMQRNEYARFGKLIREAKIKIE